MRIIDPLLLSKTLEQRLHGDIKDQKLFGAAIHVSQKGNIWYHGALGTADPVRNIPITDKTLFRLASMTKPITAIATLLLRDKGLLDLDDSVDKYLPDYSSMKVAVINDKGEQGKSNFAETKPTIRRILSHTSGIGCGKIGATQIAGMSASDKATLRNSVSYFSKQPLSFEPGSKQEYSGFPAYDVLTAIIELVTQENYEAFLKREIFAKCDMPDTTFQPDPGQWSRLTAMHSRSDGQSVCVSMPAGSIFEGIPCSHPLGGAGLVSTLDDYSHFAEMLLRDGVFRGQRILAESSVRELRSPQVAQQIQPGVCRWGLGVRVITSPDYPYLPVSTYGWSGAYGPHFWIDPVNGISAVYLKNSYYDPGAGSVTGYNFEQDVYSCMR